MTHAPDIHPQELIIRSGDKAIFGLLYRPEGDGPHPAIIFSHGYNGCHTDFTTEGLYFAQHGYLVYTFDFCGGSTRSRSSGVSTDMSVMTQRDDLLTVFDQIAAMPEVDASRVFLLGGSQGGLVTAMATEILQHRVRGMILYFPALNIPDMWCRDFEGVTDGPPTFEFWGLPLGYRFVADIIGYAPFEQLGSYQGRVLVVHGDQDPIVPLSVSQWIESTYAQAELVVLPGENHGFSAPALAQVMERTLQFLQAHA